MAKNIRQILGSKNLTGVIQGIKGGVPADILPPAFLRRTRTIEGNTCTYRKVEGTRQTARMVQYGSASVRRSQKGVSELPVTLIHSFENQIHDPNVLLNLTQIGSESKQRLGRDEIARQTRSFRVLFDNLRVSSVYSALSEGVIYFDGDGNLLPSSSGAVVTVDFDVPAANKNQLGGIIDAKWNVAGTAIHKQIAALKKQALKQTGYPIKRAFHGANTLDYLLGNTKLKELLNRNAGFQQTVAGGEIPDGFLGLNWTPVDTAFYEDADGTNQDFFGADKVVFTPDPSPEWWEVIEGSYVIPSNLGNLGSDAVASMSNIRAVNGMFSYAKVGDDPVSITQYAGDTFIPIPKVPGAIFQAEVVW